MVAAAAAISATAGFYYLNSSKVALDSGKPAALQGEFVDFKVSLITNPRFIIIN